MSMIVNPGKTFLLLCASILRVLTLPLAKPFHSIGALLAVSAFLWFVVGITPKDQPAWLKTKLSPVTEKVTNFTDAAEKHAVDPLKKKVEIAGKVAQKMAVGDKEGAQKLLQQTSPFAPSFQENEPITAEMEEILKTLEKTGMGGAIPPSMQAARSKQKTALPKAPVKSTSSPSTPARFKPAFSVQFEADAVDEGAGQTVSPPVIAQDDSLKIGMTVTGALSLPALHNPNILTVDGHAIRLFGVTVDGALRKQQKAIRHIKGLLQIGRYVDCEIRYVDVVTKMPHGVCFAGDQSINSMLLEKGFARQDEAAHKTSTAFISSVSMDAPFMPSVLAQIAAAAHDAQPEASQDVRLKIGVTVTGALRLPASDDPNILEVNGQAIRLFAVTLNEDGDNREIAMRHITNLLPMNRAVDCEIRHVDAATKMPHGVCFAGGKSINSMLLEKGLASLTPPEVP